MEKQKIKISVIIPVYNGGEWIAQCIENVLCQTYKNMEVIVVDDGSTDNTAEAAAKYPVTLLRQENSGLSATRNRGIEAATGDYIHFMDVDDWINLDYYASMVEAVELTGADMAFGGLFHEGKPNLTRLFDKRWLVSSQEDKFQLSRVGATPSCCRYIIRKSLIDSKGFKFEVGRYMEDLPFSVEAVGEANKIVTVPEAVYYYKKRKNSIINGQDPVKIRKRKEDRAFAFAARDRLMAHYGVAGVEVGWQILYRFQYKIFGIPVLEKRVFKEEKTRWYLFGLYIAQKKVKYNI